ncbi:MAG: zinc-dependent peptidase [Gammaproteobacteria bacterium]
MSVMKWLARRRLRRLLARHPIPYGLWSAATRDMDLLCGLSAVERTRLRVLAARFLRHKAINGAQGLTVTPQMAVIIAAQACLPILNLGLDYYDNWVEIIVYPAAFQVAHEAVDESGVVSQAAGLRSGESWLRGPVVLSWWDIQQGLRQSQPGNVVVHEFAHKLDMLDGRADGLPPLHADMTVRRWAEVLSAAFARLQRAAGHGCPRLDPYGASDPAEYFAVASEYFFTAPEILQDSSPAVYGQMALFYRQDPLRRRLPAQKR